MSGSLSTEVSGNKEHAGPTSRWGWLLALSPLIYLPGAVVALVVGGWNAATVISYALFWLVTRWAIVVADSKAQRRRGAGASPWWALFLPGFVYLSLRARTTKKRYTLPLVWMASAVLPPLVFVLLVGPTPLLIIPRAAVHFGLLKPDRLVEGSYTAAGNLTSCEAQLSCHKKYYARWTIQNCVGGDRCEIAAASWTAPVALQYNYSLGRWTATATRNPKASKTCHGVPVTTLEQIVLRPTGSVPPSIFGSTRTVTPATACASSAEAWDVWVTMPR